MLTLDEFRGALRDVDRAYAEHFRVSLELRRLTIAGVNINSAKFCAVEEVWVDTYRALLEVAFQAVARQLRIREEQLTIDDC